MRVLVLGAGGFIGARVVACLLSRGHVVTCAGRSPQALLRKFPRCQAVQADLLLDDVSTWLRRLTETDAVVNAAGVLRGNLEEVHHRGAVALFDACAETNLSRVLQISALGAGEQPASRFLATKHEADGHLMLLARGRGEIGWCVLRPSLVIGRGGASTALFCSLAALPRPLRLGPGSWRVQPIHVGDFARAVVDLLEGAVPPRLDLVGPEVMTIDELTLTLRVWLGLAPTRQLTFPEAALKMAARLGDAFLDSSLTSESLAMLAAGNTADPTPMVNVLNWSPRRLADALAAEPAVRADVWQARLLPLRGLLLGALLAVWVGSGFASFLVPAAESEILLSGLGLAGRPAMAVTWAGAALDVALGLALLRRNWRRPAAMAQLAIMAVYTALATVAFPSLWLDPFGPLLKNLAVLTATLAFLATED